MELGEEGEGFPGGGKEVTKASDVKCGMDQRRRTCFHLMLRG